MRIFLSYAKEQRPIAEQIAVVLRNDGHRVFFDQRDLPPGETYDDAIRSRLRDSDLMVFLASRESLTAGRYTLTELAIAEHEWPRPGTRVLPVIVDDTPVIALPPYLGRVSVLQSRGDAAAEVAAAIAQRSWLRRRFRRLVGSRWFAPVSAFVILAIVMAVVGAMRRQHVEEQRASLTSVLSEVLQNVAMVGELRENTRTLTNLARTVSEVLRIPRMRILAGLFPKENTDLTADQGRLADLYNQRMDWLAASGLLADPDETRRYREACDAILRVIGRTASTIDSLSDADGARYRVHDEVWNAEGRQVQTIAFADVSSLPPLYGAVRDARVKYDRVTRLVREYLGSVRAFCERPMPERAELGAALASERLTIGMLDDYEKQLVTVIGEVDAIHRQLAGPAPATTSSGPGDATRKDAPE